MLPEIRLLQSSGCSGLNANSAAYTADVVAFAEENEELNVIFCDESQISEAQVIANDDYIKCSALALSPEGTCILAGAPDGSLKLIQLTEPKTCAAITLSYGQNNVVSGPVEFIINAGQDKFAVGVGRSIFIIDSAGLVLKTLGPLPEPVIDLRWRHLNRHHDVARCCLFAVTSKECYIWSFNGESLGARNDSNQPIVLPCSQQQGEEESTEKPDSASRRSAKPLVAASSNSPFIALTCSNACKINCWNLDTLLTSRIIEPSPPVLTLAVYDNPVNCISFDTSGRYLATSDGPDCTIWDMPKVLQQQGAVTDADSIMCCGHNPNAKITSLAFQPDGGPLLATVSNNGNIAVFNSREFRCGGVCVPYVTAHIPELGVCGDGGGGCEEEDRGSSSRSVDSNNINEEDLGEVKLLWISGNRLLVAIPGGDLLFYSVSNVETLKNNEDISVSVAATTVAANAADENPTDTMASNEVGIIQPGMLRTLSIGQNLNPSSSFDQKACVEYSSSPLTPPRGSDDLDSVGVTIGGNGERGEVEISNEGYNIEKKESPPPQPPLPLSPQAEKEEVNEVMARPASIRTIQKRDIQPSSTESLPQPAPYSHSRGRGNTPATLLSTATPRQTTTSQHHYISAASSGGSGHHLEQRIQQLRDAPATERGDQRHHELTGWGRGIPGGLVQSPPTMPPPPWMMNAPPTATMDSVQQPVLIYPGSGGVPPMQQYGGYHAMPAEVMPAPPAMMQYGQYPQYAYPQYYPTQQMMMVVPMPQHGVASGAVPVPIPVAAPAPIPQQHSRMQPPPPNDPYPGSPSRGRGAVYSPRSPHGRSQQQQQQNRSSGGGSGVQSPRQIWHAGTIAGSVQQQQQLWAGVAPGYMAYQHRADVSRVSAPVVAPYRGGQNPSIMYMNNQPNASHIPMVHHQQHQHQQAHVTQPPSSSGNTNRGGGAAAGDAASKGKDMSEKDADKINNGNAVTSPKRSLQKRCSKGESDASNEAAAADSSRTPKRGGGDEHIVRNSSEETELSVQTHEHNNKNGAAAARGSGGFSNSSSLTPSPRQSNNHQNHKPASLGATPPLTPMGSVVPPLSLSTPSVPASSIIYIGNLPQSVDDYALYWTCSQFGPVVHVQVIRDKATNSSRGYGFVTFSHPVYAEVAMQRLNGQVIFGPFGGNRIKAAPTYKKVDSGGGGV